MKFKYLVIYHLDLDGHGAGAVVNKYLTEKEKVNPEDITWVEASYEVAPEVIIPPDTKLVIYMVDYSISESTIGWLLELLKHNVSIIWIDHHKSSWDIKLKYKEALKKFNNLDINLCDNTESGALLAYLVLFPVSEEYPTVPDFLILIDDYDRWVHKFEESMSFKYFMDSVPMQPLDPIWTELFNTRNNFGELKSKIEKGKSIEDYDIFQKRIRFADHGYFTTFGKWRVAVINSYGNSTNFPKEVFEDVDFVVRYHCNKYGTFTYSFYTYGDHIDCNVLASLLGGGGHRKAAGCTSKKVLFKPSYTLLEKWKMNRLASKFDKKNSTHYNTTVRIHI